MTAPVVLPFSSINKTVEEVGRAPENLQHLADRVITYGGGEAPSGEFSIEFEEYSVPIYQIEISNDGKSISMEYGDGEAHWSYFYPTAFSQNMGAAGNIKPGDKVPDSAAFINADGNDAVFILENRKDGRVYYFWMARQPIYNALTLKNILAGILYKKPQHIAASAYVTKPFTATKPTSQRGMGIEKRALVITGEELLEGEIKHALEMTVTNTWYCNDVKKAISGVDFFPPATRCEFSNTSYPSGRTTDKTKLVPEGLRIAFDVSDQERSDWLDRQGFTDGFRIFADMVTKCMCKYGLVVAETGGYGIGIQTTGIQGPDRPIYERFGITKSNASTKEQSLKTFFNDFKDRAFVLNPIA